MPNAPIDFSSLQSYHGAWALSTVDKKTGRLKATHYAWVTCFGPHPLWVVYTVGRKFVCYAGSKGQVADLYPSLVWRRTMMRWSLVDPTDHSIAKRREELADLTGNKPPEPQKDNV
jgi:hypothetical protein